MTSLQLTYGGVLLAVFVRIKSACLSRRSFFLIAAGALSAQGGMRTSIIVVLVFWVAWAGMNMVSGSAASGF